MRLPSRLSFSAKTAILAVIMTKKEVVLESLAFRPPPYVPWAWEMTKGCQQRVREFLGTDELTEFAGSHFLDIGPAPGRFIQLDDHCVRDLFGVVWDRSVDKEVGTPREWPIRQPEELDSYQFPDPTADVWFDAIPERKAAHPDLFCRYRVGFALYERAWALRGMSDLLMDMIERPEFVDRLLDEVMEHNLAKARQAIELGADAILFGDDYGSQRGLIMGIRLWRQFIKPRLARLFAEVRDAGRVVCLHSCGCVAELFDELVEMGLQVFNPFQPEVMDIAALKKQYHGRLAFHGGMSIQKILPFGTPDEVRAETRRLIELGREGGYIVAPSHIVPPDVPPANLAAMMEVLRGQQGFPR
ncbi:MAG: uroporphyrinogen-III decarboxylase-like protein [Phycisphaerae bacterium]|nr:uroporphyrinogen-III decarboxylase-like protein [Phycisphaerae bacterium]